ncbi:fructose-bisphosphate aldolase class I [soil metagenome]
MTPDPTDLQTFERTLRSMDGTLATGGPAPSEVAAVARELVADGRGILAADESIGTLDKRLAQVGAEPSAVCRRRYRQWLVTAPGLGRHVSGVILYDETIRQATGDGTPFPAAVTAAGMAPGIKVDTGTAALAGHPGEQVTSGLDGLRDRLAEYRTLGARFAKWRAVVSVGDDHPSRACLRANAQVMARYAGLCHEAGIVPVVEPEVLMDGDHGLGANRVVTAAALAHTFAALADLDVAIDAVLVKVNMVLPGEGSAEDPDDEEVAAATLGVLRNTIPAAVPGVVFLSGGQSPLAATRRLNAINELAVADPHGPAPWRLSFSYARALQGPALAAWDGAEGNVEAAQRLLVQRARCTSAAATGCWDPALEDAAPQ